VLSFICIGANSSWSILNSRLVEFGQESRFLFHHARVMIMSPLKGQVHYIDCMFIHFFSCMHPNKKWVPYESATPNFERKTWEIKNVLVAALILEKSWSLWTKAWLASSLLEQTLKNTSGEGPSNRSAIFVQTPTTQPKETGGQTWSKASTQSEGELHRRMEPVLVLLKKKRLPLLDHACKNFLIFCFNLSQFLSVIWLKIPQGFPCPMSLSC
jgi:hypothetical protein